MTTDETLIIHYSKMKSALLVVLAFTMLCLSIWIIYFSKAPFRIEVCAWIMSVMCVGALIIKCRSLWSGRVPLVIDRHGITDHSHGTSIGFIPWSDIEGFRDKNIAGRSYIQVDLKNPDKYGMKGSFLQQLANQISLISYDSPVNINTSTLDKAHDQILESLSDFLSFARGEADIDA